MPWHCIITTLEREMVLFRSEICSVQGQSQASLTVPIPHLLFAVISMTVVYDVLVGNYDVHTKISQYIVVKKTFTLDIRFFICEKSVLH